LSLVLGDLISKVSGMSFDDYQKKEILDPLGMNLSTFLYEMPPDLEATPHVRRLKVQVSDVYPYNRAHGPSSTLHSNVLEMCNWAIANLNRGTLNGKRILKESSYDQMWTPIVRVGPSVERGLSWFLTEHDGRRVVFHNGGDLGFRSTLVLLPDDSLAVVTMSNLSGAPLSSVTDALVEVALGGMPDSIPPLLAPISYPVMEILEDEGVDAAVAYFHEQRADTTAKYRFHEAYLNNLGYQLIGMGRLSDAKAVLRANIEAYPDGANTYDSYGEVCMLMGDNEEAIANYRGSLELNPENTNAVEKLEELEK
jgi:CubicO group peptidase (beta-lactamase class C family)